MCCWLIYSKLPVRTQSGNEAYSDENLSLAIVCYFTIYFFKLLKGHFKPTENSHNACIYLFALSSSPAYFDPQTSSSHLSLKLPTIDPESRENQSLLLAFLGGYTYTPTHTLKYERVTINLIVNIIRY